MPPASDLPSTGKRKQDRSISPPPTKRKAQSSINKGAVASFFTPASQKPKDPTAWSERAPDDSTPATLLVGRYEPDPASLAPEHARKKRRKIAAFDLDSTLITTVSGKKHSADANDWKWWDPCVPSKLRELYTQDDYQIIILSNQAGLSLSPDPKGPKNLKNRVANFKQKAAAILASLDLPTSVYAATGKDMFRKPRVGMWAELCRDYDIPESEVDMGGSIFVGDAGGRTALVKPGGATVAKDFSCSDRNLAHNIGIPYQTPEEYFLGEPPREFARDFDLAAYPFAEADAGAATDDALFEKKAEQEMVLFCGPPGAGKSTFYWTYLKPLGFERVNQDTLKTRAKCLKAAGDLLGEGDSVVVDNTNPDPAGRQEWVALARKHRVPVRCVWFHMPMALCEHNDAVRAMNKAKWNPEARTALPKLAFNAFFPKLKEPKVSEGFEDVTRVDFKFRGTRDEYAVWGRYWN